jgi:hypothetical protein
VAVELFQAMKLDAFGVVGLGHAVGLSLISYRHLEDRCPLECSRTRAP